MGFDWGSLFNIGAQGIGSYLQYQDKKDRTEQFNRSWEAQEAAKVAASLANQQAASRRSGGGGGNKKKAASLLSEYYAKSDAMLKPYRDAAVSALPQMTETFNRANTNLAPVTNQVLSEDFIRNFLQQNQNPEILLPEYAAGAKK